MVVNRNSAIPLYHQIRDELREDLISGRFVPGDRIPSESELSARYNVSRITAKQAIQSLVQEGLLYRLHGKGTFVAKSRVEHSLNRLMSFSEQMQNRGMRPSAKVLEVEVAVARGEVTKALALSRQSLVTKIKRLRYADDEPMGIQTAYVPLDICPNLADAIEGKDFSLYEVLKKEYGLVVARALEKYVAVLPDESDARLLGIPEGSPVLRAERVSYLSDNRPLEYVVSILRSDRYVLYVELHQDRG